MKERRITQAGVFACLFAVFSLSTCAPDYNSAPATAANCVDGRQDNAPCGVNGNGRITRQDPPPLLCARALAGERILVRP